MTTNLKYFSYVSRSKVAQLYEQITDFSVDKKSVKSSRGTEAKAEAGSNSILSVITGGLRIGGQYTRENEEVGSITVIQKLMKVIEHIQRHEKVLDLAEVYRKQENVALNAFCYEYTGNFYVMGEIDRNRMDFRINGSALERLDDDEDLLVSKKLLIEPGRQENSYKEIGPNQSSLVSDFCIIASRMGKYTLELACSYKYFSDMGGHYYEHSKEWEVRPHSGNHFFFHGSSETWFESLVFINGIRGKTIMGSPLFLVHTANPNLRL